MFELGSFMIASPHLTTGIGLRHPHIDQILDERPKLGFLEVHTENYFGGGVKLKKLGQLRCDYELSLHGVGLSLGRADGLDLSHLDQIKALNERFAPRFISEHLSFSAFSHSHVPDLLAMPLTSQSMDIFVQHIDQVQSHLERTILIENPSNYMAFIHQDYDEPSFLSQLSTRTGCHLLLDINNIYVSSQNMGFKAKDYISALPKNAAIAEFHLAGHELNQIGDETLLIDTHGDVVCAEVWALYHHALDYFGDRDSLIEWDSHIPDLSLLIGEAHKADHCRQGVLAHA